MLACRYSQRSEGCCRQVLPPHLYGKLDPGLSPKSNTESTTCPGNRWPASCRNGACRAYSAYRRLPREQAEAIPYLCATHALHRICSQDRFGRCIGGSVRPCGRGPQGYHPRNTGDRADDACSYLQLNVKCTTKCTISPGVMCPYSESRSWFKSFFQLSVAMIDSGVGPASDYQSLGLVPIPRLVPEIYGWYPSTVLLSRLILRSQYTF